MKFKVYLLLILFTFFLFTPICVVILDSERQLTMLINEIDEKEETKSKNSEKEYVFLEKIVFLSNDNDLKYHEYLNKEIFSYTRHYIEEDVPPPERI
jgi:hypothetical protein